VETILISATKVDHRRNPY